MEKHKRVLITGGHGFIGCHVSRLLIKQGHTVGIVDSYRDYNHYWQHNVGEYEKVRTLRKDHSGDTEIYETDILDDLGLENAFAKFRPDVVIHLASCPNAKILQFNAREETETAIQGTLRVLEMSVKYNVHRFVLSSSSMVYGNFKVDEPDEIHKCFPQTLYGSYKLANEFMVKSFNKDNPQLTYSILRPSAVYGTNDVTMRVISQMAKSAYENNEITVTGPTNRLDFTWVEDLAEAFSLAAFHDGAMNQTFNASRGRGRNILEAAELVKHHLGIDCKIWTKSADPFYPNRDTLNSRKLKHQTGWNPQVDIEEGIKRYCEYFLLVNSL